jgi:hypothetical protein
MLPVGTICLSGVLDYVDRNQRKRGLASASIKSGSMAASVRWSKADIRQISDVG